MGIEVKGKIIYSDHLFGEKIKGYKSITDHRPGETT